MREIKFRAWDSEEHKMLIVTRLDFMNYADGRENKNCEGYFGDNHRRWFDKNTCQLMQNTGLKDKNGKEIYEGDIFDMGVVIFSRGCFNGCYISGSTNEKGWDYSDDWEDGLYSYALQNEIIGNIYENPELSLK